MIERISFNKASERAVWCYAATRRANLGSTSVEYSVITLIVITVLFLPLPGLGDSLVSTFVSALKQFQSNSTFLMSMP